MRLTFRQGIARYQTDIYATPAFLKKSAQNGEFIDLIVSPDPTIVIFAHRSATYVMEETRTVTHAWGPFLGNRTCYLYWDINLLDASVSRGITYFPQAVSGTAPVNPAVDQHWYDTVEHQMKVWNGKKWLDKLRVFAATYSSQGVIVPFPMGTQANEVGSFEGGNVILDAFNKPLRQTDGTFVTTVTGLTVTNASTKKIKFEAEVISAMASENIPKFSFVQAEKGKKFKLARSTDWRSRIIGVATEDLYESEIGNIESNGLLRNEQWNWPDSSVGKPVFCGPTGEITLAAPTTGVLQIAGYVVDKDSIFLNLKQVTILSDVRNRTDQPVQAPGTAPIADFTASQTIGVAPLRVEFQSVSVHNPTSWEWDFKNDGTIDSTQKNVGYTFNAGTHAVRLKVRNAFGEDQIVKEGLIIVSAPVEKTGVNTNLSIQLSSPLQIDKNQEFSITVTSANDGYQTANNVTRTIYIKDVADAVVEITNKPTASKTTRVGSETILSLPMISSIAPGKQVTSTFTIKAPSKNGVIDIRAGVASPENDSTLSDNIATLSIRVK